MMWSQNAPGDVTRQPELPVFEPVLSMQTLQRLTAYENVRKLRIEHQRDLSGVSPKPRSSALGFSPSSIDPCPCGAVQIDAIIQPPVLSVIKPSPAVVNHHYPSLVILTIIDKSFSIIEHDHILSIIGS